MKQGDILVEGKPASQVVAEAIRKGWAHYPLSKQQADLKQVTDAIGSIDLVELTNTDPKRALNELKRLGK